MNLSSRIDRLEGTDAGTPTGAVILYDGTLFSDDATYNAGDGEMDAPTFHEWLLANAPEFITYLPDNHRAPY